MISCQFGSWKQVLTKKYTSLVSMQKSPVMKKVHSVRIKPTELTAVRESRENDLSGLEYRTKTVLRFLLGIKKIY